MSSDVLKYYSVVGPGRNTLASFRYKEDAERFQNRVIESRLAQLDRIKESLTSGEYKGEVSFRKYGVIIIEKYVEFMTLNEALSIPDDQLVDGRFLAPSCRRLPSDDC